MNYPISENGGYKPSGNDNSTSDELQNMKSEQDGVIVVSKKKGYIAVFFVLLLLWWAFWGRK